MSPAAADDPGPGGADSTIDLLERARSGDAAALDMLFARYLQPLRRWARGRLPQKARRMADTQDLVQETLIQVFRHVNTFEPRGEGAFQAYLRQAVMNRVRNAIRDDGRRPSETGLDDAAPSTEQSPLELAIGVERVEQYEAALDQLKPHEREALVARIEMGCTYEEMAALLDLPSADAARKAAKRALVKLAEAMARAAG
jgi:RNA polymerase sigma factor (sigma-70 family)